MNVWPFRLDQGWSLRSSGGGRASDEGDALREVEAASSRYFSASVRLLRRFRREDRLSDNAREEIMNQCFAGGDYNHKQQAGNVWNAYKNCAGTP
ncbi:hypothetical protein [Variovorax sp. YR750]|uniref:hypothetical protein n=1 Tax=Variovorax sp. YR750 TaxID=1884384 RepID=UPI001160CA60|nr:hypothetical protein [Variovorax sp. YR750]